jgi:hypothetical protein
LKITRPVKDKRVWVGFSLAALLIAALLALSCNGSETSSRSGATMTPAQIASPTKVASVPADVCAERSLSLDEFSLCQTLGECRTQFPANKPLRMECFAQTLADPDAGSHGPAVSAVLGDEEIEALNRAATILHESSGPLLDELDCLTEKIRAPEQVIEQLADPDYPLAQSEATLEALEAREC